MRSRNHKVESGIGENEGEKKYFQEREIFLNVKSPSEGHFT